MLVEPLIGDGDLDGKRQPILERGQRPAQPVLGERARMQPAGQLAQLLEPGVELTGGILQQLGRPGRVLVELGLGDAQQQRRCDEPLLGAVVEVALQSATLFVAGSNDAGARRLEILAGLRARDRERDEVAERGEAELGIRRAADRRSRS